MEYLIQKLVFIPAAQRATLYFTDVSFLGYRFLLYSTLAVLECSDSMAIDPFKILHRCTHFCEGIIYTSSILHREYTQKIPIVHLWENVYTKAGIKNVCYVSFPQWQYKASFFTKTLLKYVNCFLSLFLFSVLVPTLTQNVITQRGVGNTVLCAGCTQYCWCYAGIRWAFTDRAARHACLRSHWVNEQGSTILSSLAK